MDFKPSTIINNERQPTHICTIDKCMVCPLKRTCSQYLEHLENRISQQTNKIQSSGLDTKELMSYIEKLNNRVNELTEIIVNVAEIRTVDSQDAPEPVLTNSSIESTTEIKNDSSGIVESNTTIQSTQIDNTTIPDESQGIKVEEIIAQNNENGLAIYDSNNQRKVLQERKNIFGKPTGKYKEVKVK